MVCFRTKSDRSNSATMRLLPHLAISISLAASAQTYNISTIAGGALPVNIAGSSASLDSGVPLVLTAVDPATSSL
jgi:hypothetical protein